MPTLLLIRHGENDVMRTRLAGRLPGTHLNPVGQSQARAVAAALAGLSVKAIFSSPLERAIETAEPLARLFGLPIQPHAGLLELDYGQWAGKTYKQLGRIRLWKELHQHVEQTRFPGGETLGQAQQRAVAALSEISTALGKDDLAVCFTHGDIVRLAVSHYLNMPLNAYFHLSADPTGVSVLVFHPEGVQVTRVNQRLSAPLF